jgi:hypothetical protein
MTSRTVERQILRARAAVRREGVRHDVSVPQG